MRRTKLSPFVHKVKGEKNTAVFDVLEGRMFQLVPEGNVPELQAQLVDAGLAVETEGVIPFKFRSNISNYRGLTLLRELQLRITGECDRNCPGCGENLCSCFTGKGEMSRRTLRAVFDQVRYLPIERLLITGGNPLRHRETLAEIKENIAADRFLILFKGDIRAGEKNFLDKLDIQVVRPADPENEIKAEDMSFNAFSFFYNQAFNPCWGNKMAVDVDGSIKPCLWAGDTLGNINKNNLKEMIVAQRFDKYWELAKDKIDTCRVCEYRYVCGDCRPHALENTGSLYNKPPNCKYNPADGEWSG